MCRLRGVLVILLFQLTLLLDLELQAKDVISLTPAEISELAALTSEKIPEIHEARVMASAAGARLATYGGLSREVITFMTERINSLGSVEAYRAFLAKPEPIHLGDLHRMKSDMDFMILPNEGSAELSPARSDEIAKLKSRIAAKFPPDIFHAKMDMNVAAPFFSKFPPGKEHFEAVSNLPITDRGVEFLPELNVTRNGQTTNLARWGLDQYSRRTLELEINPNGLKPGDTYGNLRQVLRWVRYLSENPDATVSDTTRTHIKQLLHDTLATHKAEVLHLLKGRSSESSKTLDAVDKLQRYTKSSSYTAELLREYGIADLMTQASSDHSILTPMAKASGSPLPTENVKRLGLRADGEPFVVNHYTSYAAAQNMSAGALWRSDNSKEIEGRAMRNMGGFAMPVLYTSVPTGDTHMAASAETRVTFVLNPDAVEGVDFERRGNVFGLITENAIAKDATGAPKIQRPTFASLRTELIERLENRQIRIHPQDRETLVRSLAGILRPALNEEDAKLFFRLLEQEHEFSSLPAYMLTQVVKTNPTIFSETTPTALKLRKALIGHIDSPSVRGLIGREIPVTEELIKDIFIGFKDRSYLSAGHKELLADLREHIKPEILRPIIAELSSPKEASHRVAHEALEAIRPSDADSLNAIVDEFVKTPNLNFGASGLLRDLKSDPEIERRMGEILATSKDRNLISSVLYYFGTIDWRTASHGYSRDLVGVHPIQSEEIRKLVMSYLKDPDSHFRDQALRALAQIPNVAELEPELVQVAVRRLGSSHEGEAAAKILDGYKGADKMVKRRVSDYRMLSHQYFSELHPDDSGYYGRLHTQPPLVAKFTNSRIGDAARSCSARFGELFRSMQGAR